MLDSILHDGQDEGCSAAEDACVVDQTTIVYLFISIMILNFSVLQRVIQ